MIALLVTFFVVCLATAFVCTAVKEDEDRHLATQTLRLMRFMVLAIAAFAVVVEVVTRLAG